MTVIPSTLDLTPSTRILPMLGEISLEQWQCLAELIDNPVDAFLTAKRNGMPLEDPKINVSLPTTNSASSIITITDNGPGMDLQTLNNAVKAGWTSNNPMDSLGLFGMGFNIATARLAQKTRILSARAGDPEWFGVEIDFDLMRTQSHFDAPVIREPKSDPNEHGTRVEISNIKPGQLETLSKTATHSKITKRLARVYSTMLDTPGHPIHFKLYVNNKIVNPVRHCVWDETRVSQGTRGQVAAVQTISVSLAPRRFCSLHLEWLSAEVKECPTCHSAQHVEERQRKITGWIGLQRYLSERDYGIDFIRNGRKIEVDNRDLFLWNDNGAIETEYPIDDPRNRGRIIGEIHLDHCRVHYTKDRFDRSDPSWDEMSRVVHGDGPLQPRKSEALGFAPNTSPLSALYQRFRRSTPKSPQQGDWKRLIVVKDNERATDMAERFRRNEPAYQTDAEWWKLVEEQDDLLATGGGAGTGTSPATPAPVGGSAFPTPNGVPSPAAPPAFSALPAAPPTQRSEMLALSREYSSNGRNFRVKAYAVETTDPILGSDAWSLKTEANGDWSFYFSPSHDAFRSVTLTPLDALISEVAFRVADSLRGTSTTVSYASILTSLRERYSKEFELNERVLVADANRVLSEIAGSLARNVTQEDARALFQGFPQEQQSAVHTKMLANRIDDPYELISNGRFLEFARRPYLVTFLTEHPERFFDGKYWDVKYAGIDWGSASATEAAKAELLKTYMSWLEDAAWLSESEGGALTSPSRDRLLRASMSLRLLSENVVSADDT